MENVIELNTLTVINPFIIAMVDFYIEDGLVIKDAKGYGIKKGIYIKGDIERYYKTHRYAVCEYKRGKIHIYIKKDNDKFNKFMKPIETNEIEKLKKNDVIFKEFFGFELSPWIQYQKDSGYLVLENIDKFLNGEYDCDKKRWVINSKRKKYLKAFTVYINYYDD